MDLQSSAKVRKRIKNGCSYASFAKGSVKMIVKERLKNRN